MWPERCTSCEVWAFIELGIFALLPVESPAGVKDRNPVIDRSPVHGDVSLRRR